MRTYTFKSIAQRGTLLSTAALLVAATMLPAEVAFADALNPLTERSLALSSSSPGWSNTDGSENSTYAPPNSGANGQKTGNTFSFRVSTDTTSTPVKAFTFQYCTTPAGGCTAPGNDYTNGGTRGTDDFATQRSDLKIVTSSPAEIGSSDFSTIVDTTTGVVKAVPGYAGYNNGKHGSDAESGIGGAGAAVAGNFVVYYDTGSGWAISPVTWTMAASSVASPTTTANNMITLTNSTGQGFASGTHIKVVFFGTDDNYIQNPGADHFFVRMNTYKSDTTLTDANILDGGVTVANVMNQSIWIQTKVLETMEFSVGTVDPNTLDSSDGDATSGSEAPSTLEKGLFATADLAGKKGETKHIPCGRILGAMTPQDATNVLKLGDQTAESSLATDHTYSTHSYWRLSSNSSAGATVYYSGHTLTNTVGDEIKPMESAKDIAQAGSEQFGLALDNAVAALPSSQADLKVDYAQEATYEHGNDDSTSTTTGPVTAGVHPSTLTDVGSNGSWHLPTLYPLLPATNYSEGAGDMDGTGTVGTDAKFAFVRTSDTIPEPLASESDQVVDCVTGKMRYIANIAATTPAGIYTTKVNYIAAPQY